MRISVIGEKPFISDLREALTKDGALGEDPPKVSDETEQKLGLLRGSRNYRNCG